jgi:hypothetical protein
LADEEARLRHGQFRGGSGSIIWEFSTSRDKVEACESAGQKITTSLKARQKVTSMILALSHRAKWIIITLAGSIP